MPAYVTLPGTTGNYFDTPQSNILDADDAHFHQGVGNWTAGAGASALAHDTTTVPSNFAFGDGAAKITTDGTGAVIATLTTPSLAAAEHTIAIDVYTDTPDREAFITLDGTDGTVVPLTAGIASRLTVTKTVTSGTKTVSITYRQTDDSDPAASETVWLAKGCLLKAASADFVRSIRVVGDIDMRAKIADTWSDGDIAYVFHCNQAQSSGGFAMVLRNDTGTVRFDYTENDGTARQFNTSVSLTDDQVYVFRCTWDVSSPEVTLYIDGVQENQSTSAGFANGGQYPGTLSQDLTVGTNTTSANLFDGDLYYVEIRDGIDGPVVARFDADDWVGVSP